MLICPRCGSSDSEKEFIEAFCVDCYEIKIKIPQKLKFERCKRCGRMLLQGKWSEFDEHAIGQYIVSKCRGEFINAIYDHHDQSIVFFIKKGSKISKITKMINVNIEIIMCSDCSRMSSGYFEAIIQLRGRELRIKKYERVFKTELARKTFVSKVEEKKEGIDLYVGSTKAVMELLKEMKLTYKISRTLFGRKEGRNVYRTTFAIRFE